MSYSVIDDDESLQVRASILYHETDDLVTLIETLQNRLAKMLAAKQPMEKVSGKRSSDTVQSLPDYHAGSPSRGNELDSSEAESQEG